jgi:hypothetical protein
VLGHTPSFSQVGPRARPSGARSATWLPYGPRQGQAPRLETLTVRASAQPPALRQPGAVAAATPPGHTLTALAPGHCCGRTALVRPRPDARRDRCYIGRHRHHADTTI